MPWTNQLLQTCLLAGLWVAAVCAAAQAESVAVTFNSEASVSGGAALRITGTLSRPKGDGPFPAVVLLPNCGGPATYEFAVFWPRYLNELGYVTLNVDPFTPRKAKKCTQSYMPDVADLAGDAYGALGYLAGLSYVDRERIGVLGSSLGAHAINAFAGSRRAASHGLTFKSAVSLYPVHCRALTVRAGMIPTLIVQGDRERGARSCKARIGLRHLAIIILPNTHHGFDQPSATPRKDGRLRRDVKGNKRLYNRQATQRAQVLVKKFLAARMPQPTGQSDPGPEKTPVLGKVGNKDPYKAVAKRDTDGDGRVSLSEWEKSSVFFAKIDADQDGYLTPKEFFDHWQKRARK